MADWHKTLMKSSMADKVLLDTWAWLTLKDRTEKKHSKVIKYCENAVKTKSRLYTTDFILSETFTLLFKRMHTETALTALKDIEESIEGGYIELIRIDQERFKKSIELRRKLKDKPDISFVDISTMVVMKHVGIKKIITGDAHFQHVGFDFQLML